MKFYSIILTLAAVASMAAGSAQAQTTTLGTEGNLVLDGSPVGSTSYPYDCVACGSGANAVVNDDGNLAIGAPLGSSLDGIGGKEALRTETLVNLRAHLMGAWASADTARHIGFVRNDAACQAAAEEGMGLVDQAAGSYFKIVEFYRQFPADNMTRLASAAYQQIEQANELTSICAGEEGRLRAQKYLRGALEHPRPIADIQR
jgi:hypothetical protein